MSPNGDRQNDEKMTSAQACQIYLSDWKSGRSRTLEELLSKVAPAERTQALRSLLIVEFRRRLDSGEKPREKEYLRRFPDAASIIDEVLEMFPQESSAELKSTEQVHDKRSGSEIQVAAKPMRGGSKDSTQIPVSKSKSHDRLPQVASPVDEPQSKIEKSVNDGAVTTNRLFDPPEQLAPSRPNRKSSESRGNEETEQIEARINPLDLADLVAPKTVGKTRSPIMKLVLDWAASAAFLPTSRTFPDHEISPDSLFQQLTEKPGAVVKRAPSKYGNVPQVTLMRSKSSSEVDIPTNSKDLRWKDNQILLAVIGTCLFLLFAVMIWIFVNGTSQPIQMIQQR